MNIYWCTYYTNGWKFSFNSYFSFYLLSFTVGIQYTWNITLTAFTMNEYFVVKGSVSVIQSALHLKRDIH